MQKLANNAKKVTQLRHDFLKLIRNSKKITFSDIIKMGPIFLIVQLSK